MRSKEVVVYHPSSPMLEKEGMVPPLGAIHLGTILKERGHKVKVIDECGQEPSLAEMTDCDVLIVASVTTPQYPLAKKMLDQILEEKHKGRSVPITALGGPDATYLGPQRVEDGWDFVCGGWGDHVVAPVVEGDVTDKYIFGKIMLNKEELNALPIPDFRLVKGGLEGYRRSAEHDMTLPIITSRGCPHDCSFCSNKLWRRRVEFDYPETAIRKAKSVKDLGVNQIVMYDDDALINYQNRVMKISNGIESFDTVWRCNTHVNTIDNKAARDGLLDAIRDAGCVLVALGVDGVDDKILKEFNKGTTMKRCLSAIESVREAGMLVKVYLIYPPVEG